MRPLVSLVVACLSIVMLFCFTSILVCGAYTFNNYIESQRELLQKEQSDKVIQAMSQVAEKIPDFRLLSRKNKRDNGTNNNRTRGVFGR